MKRLFFMMCTLLAIAACSNVDDAQQGVQEEMDGRVFHATFADDNTRTYLDEQIRLRWTAEDQVTIFAGKTRNKPYKFQGETGDNAGDFEEVKTSIFGTGNSIETNIAVYPYVKTTKISDVDNSITYEWPTVQTYTTNTVGLGANVMVANTGDVENTELAFMNVGSFLQLKLYGQLQMVKKITIEGKNGELLAGRSTIVCPADGEPSCEMAAGASTSLEMECTDGVLVGQTKDQATKFWIVLPVTNFTQGFSVTVEGYYGGSQTFNINTAVEFPRNIYKGLTLQLTDLTVGAELYGSDEITASINGVSRTYLDTDGLTTFWLEGDKLGVFTQQGRGNLLFVSPTASDAYSGKFRGSLNGETPLFAYYPYSANAGSDRTAITLSLPTEQDVTRFGDYDYKSSVSSVAKASSTTLDFKGLMSVIRISVNAVDTELAGCHLTSVTFTALPLNEGDAAPAVSGDFVLNLETRTTKFGGTTYDYARLVWPTSHDLAESVAVGNVQINPDAVHNGTKYVVVIDTEEGKRATVTTSTSKDFAPNTRYTMTLNLANRTDVVYSDIATEE